MRFRRHSWVLMVLLAAGLVAQAQRTGNLSTDQRVLTGTEWKLISLGSAGAEADVVPGTTVTVSFGEDGRASGSTGCNSYSGTYQVRGDSITFGRLISTRRACVDQNANQQEQRFLAALETANRFRLSSNRLTILSDRGRNVLNFVSNTPDEPDDNGPPGDDRADPVTALSSYYRAINERDYRRAYRFWETPQSSFEQFARGFADTQSVRIMVEPAAGREGAAGSVYTEIPTIVIATTRSGNERVFAGCYVMRKSNVRDGGWLIYRADVTMMPSSARVSRMLSQTCRNSR